MSVVSYRRRVWVTATAILTSAAAVTTTAQVRPNGESTAEPAATRPLLDTLPPLHDSRETNRRFGRATQDRLPVPSDVLAGRVGAPAPVAAELRGLTWTFGVTTLALGLAVAALVLRARRITGP
jgi:hypothetical protein